MPDFSIEPRLLPLADVQRMLGISRSQVYRLLGRGELSARKIGDRLLVEAASIDSYFEKLPRAVINTGRRRRRQPEGPDARAA